MNGSLNYNLKEKGEIKMKELVREFAIGWQEWASEQSLSYGELDAWAYLIELMANCADESGKLLEEFKENGIL